MTGLAFFRTLRTALRLSVCAFTLAVVSLSATAQTKIWHGLAWGSDKDAAIRKANEAGWLECHKVDLNLPGECLSCKGTLEEEGHAVLVFQDGRLVQIVFTYRFKNLRLHGAVVEDFKQVTSKKYGPPTEVIEDRIFCWVSPGEGDAPRGDAIVLELKEGGIVVTYSSKEFASPLVSSSEATRPMGQADPSGKTGTGWF